MAMRSTAPGADRVYCATQSTKRRTSSGRGGASSTSSTGFSLSSGTARPPREKGLASSHTTAVVSRPGSGTRTKLPGAGAWPATA